MTESTVKNGLRMLRAMDNLPDDMLAAARLPDGAAAGNADRDGKRGAGLGNNPWFAAAAAIAVAFSVLALIVWAGRNAGGSGTPIVGTAARETGDTEVSEPVVTQDGTVSATEPATAEPPVEAPEEMPYAFVCGQQVAEPKTGLWWCEITQDDGSVLAGDGGGLAYELLEMENPPTITVSAHTPFILSFVCRTEEQVGTYHLWDDKGASTLAHFDTLSELADYTADKPGTYFVTADINYSFANEQGRKTKSIRLVVKKADEPSVAVPDDIPYAFVWKGESVLPASGLIWGSYQTDNGDWTEMGGSDVPPALRQSDNPPTITLTAADTAGLTFIHNPDPHYKETIGTVTLWSEDWERVFSCKNLSALTAYTAYLAGKSGVWYVTVEITRTGNGLYDCLAQGIRLIVE